MPFYAGFYICQHISRWARRQGVWQLLRLRQALRRLGRHVVVCICLLFPCSSLIYITWHITCSLEMWYYTVVLILMGCLKNLEIQVDVISIWSVPFVSNRICLCISLRTRLIGLPLTAMFGFKLKLNAIESQAWTMCCCCCVFDGLPSSKAICWSCMA